MLRVGLIGVGYLGKIHLSWLKQMNNIQLVGFYDSNKENSATVQQQHQIESYSNANDLLNDVDAVVLATPTTTHFDYAKKCIHLGKHIFIEKPAASTIEEVKELQAFSKETSLVIQVGMVERFNPAFIAARPNLLNIQKIFCTRLAPFTPRGADVSVVFDVMIHDLDIVMSLVGNQSYTIQSYGEKIISTTYDIANALVKFENGMVAHFTASRMAERKYRQTDVLNAESGFRIDFLHKKAGRYALPGSTAQGPYDGYLGPSAHPSTYQELPIEPTNAIEQELKSFVHSIIHNKKVVVSLDDGIRSMELAKEIEDQMNLEF